MSSRILRSAAAALATPVAWPTIARKSAGGVGGPESRAVTAEAGPPPPDMLAEIERRIALAREAAFREGEAAGMARSASRLDPLVARFSQTIEQLASQRSRLRREAEQDLVKLAVAIARRVLHREMSVDPQALLGVVRAALDKLDAREVHRVRFNPEDLEILRGRVDAGRSVELTGDPALERGAVIFETTRGVLDASVETQLGEIERGLADLVRSS